MTLQMDRLPIRQHTHEERETCQFKTLVSTSQTVICELNAMYSYGSLELVVWNSDVGFAIGSLDELVDGHDLTLHAIHEAAALEPYVRLSLPGLGRGSRSRMST